MITEPTDEIKLKDYLFYFIPTPLILCIVYLKKIKGLNQEENAAITVSLSYIILFMFIGLAIAYNIIPVYVYFILSCISPFAVAYTPLKNFDFIHSIKFFGILKSFFKKKILKRSVVRLRIESSWIGVIYTTDITYYKNNKQYCGLLRTNRLDKWE